jgi:hypothetical protein
MDPLGLTKGGKQNISVNHNGQVLTKKTPVKVVQKAIEEAKKAQMSTKHLSELRGLLKVIKRGGMIGALGPLS